MCIRVSQLVHYGYSLHLRFHPAKASDPQPGPRAAENARCKQRFRTWTSKTHPVAWSREIGEACPPPEADVRRGNRRHNIRSGKALNDSNDRFLAFEATEIHVTDK
jgi:hypothetical protein